ncbi:MAG: glycosyltransferase [Verrucomicrobiota bacterium]
MKVSGFTFLRNGQKLGYPFVASIRSILPIVDEFIVALGPCDDDTEKLLRGIGDPKIRIIPTQWNERIRNDYSIKGFVYGQQKSIALFNCTGDWAFYLEGDEVVHEDDLLKIQASMETHLDNEKVEALYFDYIHFLGNRNTRVWSPGWYRTAPRILRNTIPAWAPKGLFFVVLESQKKSRYPKAAPANAFVYHYGNMRTQEQWNLKAELVGKYWSNQPKPFTYADVDPIILKPFVGKHPKAVQEWLPPAEGLYQPPLGRPRTFRDLRHRLMLKFENWFGLDFAHKHYKRAA